MSSSHPGTILFRDFMKPNQLNFRRVATRLMLEEPFLLRFLGGSGRVTADLALRLGRAFNTSPIVWINLQTAYDLEESQLVSHDWMEIQPFERFLDPPEPKVLVTYPVVRPKRHPDDIHQFKISPDLQPVLEKIIGRGWTQYQTLEKQAISDIM